MSWRDRDHAGDDPRPYGRPGGDWQGIRPTLDNPMSWAFPLVRVLRIDVRVHVVFVIYIVIRLLRSLSRPSVDDAVPLGFGLSAMWLAALFVIVLLHEFGHCLACRRVGGEADEILMWPLGGLAFCRPPQHWRAHFLTAAGGPMVNVLIFVLLAPTLWLVTGRGWGVAIPDPFGYFPFGALGREPWWLLAMYTVHDASFLLLLFNLLPIFPLDGGRLVQAALWPRAGYVRSMRLAVYTGYFGAIALGIVGAVFQEWMLVAIAVFGGVTCYVTLKQLQWTEEVVGGEDDRFAASLWGPGDGDEADAAPAPVEPRREQKARKRAKAEAEEAREVDRILAKIGREGMESLSGREARILRRATERKRGDGA